jgi:hypothetical protein
MILNIDKNWTRLVTLSCKVLRKVQVTDDRPPVPVKSRRHV